MSEDAPTPFADDAQALDDAAGAPDPSAPDATAPDATAPDATAPDATAPDAPLADESLDPAWVPAELVAYRVLVALIALAGAAVTAWRLGFDLTGIAAALVSAAFAYWLLMGVVRALVRRQFEATSWMVDDAHLRIRKGVWWRRELHVPRSRIQHTDVTQGPLQRSYGVATLVVHTAGTAYSTVSLDGLTHARAQQLRDKLVLENGDDGV